MRAVWTANCYRAKAFSVKISTFGWQSLIKPCLFLNLLIAVYFGGFFYHPCQEGSLPCHFAVTTRRSPDDLIFYTLVEEQNLGGGFLCSFNAVSKMKLHVASLLTDSSLLITETPNALRTFILSGWGRSLLRQWSINIIARWWLSHDSCLKN